MDINLSLDEIIERKRFYPGGGRPNDKKFHLKANASNKLVNKPAFKPAKQSSLLARPQQPQQLARSYDARNKIIQKTRAKIADARDILNKNMRQSGVDARQLLLERKKGSLSSLLGGSAASAPAIRGTSGHHAAAARANMNNVHKGRFENRVITMSNRPGAVIQTLWDSKESRPSGINKLTHSRRPFLSRSTDHMLPKPFAPRGYVDHDNMQEMEDEEITRTLHIGSYNKPTSISAGGVSSRFNFGNFDMDEEMSPTLPVNKKVASDPFAIYESARNRIERPALVSDAVEKLYELRRRNLPESLRARLFGSEPDRRISHGIYANENGSQGNAMGMGSSMGSSGLASSGLYKRRSPPPPPLSIANHKPGYRLLVSNLHANVTTTDIRELFNDIGPMYEAHVVRPGTAEVIYKSLEHAEMAVDAYHQREFDGMPMHCVLVNPHSSNRPTMSANSRTVTTNSSGVEVDIDALHSVLFRDR